MLAAPPVRFVCTRPRRRRWSCASVTPSPPADCETNVSLGPLLAETPPEGPLAPVSVTGPVAAEVGNSLCMRPVVLLYFGPAGVLIVDQPDGSGVERWLRPVVGLV